MAYTLEPNGALTRVPSPPRGGLMGLRDRGGALRTAAPLCRAIVSECRKNGYRGVLADLDPTAQDRLPFLTQLSRALIAQGRVLYCPMQLPAEGARLLVGTAVSGGSLRALLESAVNRFGAERLALDLERVRMDFPLPCPTGCGVPLKAEEFDVLRRKAPDAVFYSRELMANYFTYSSAEGTRFVLFDDAQTLRKKCALAASLGIEEAFVMYPEVADLL